MGAAIWSENARPAKSHERLAALIQAHKGALLAHPEAQATHEAMISLLQGVDSGEITIAQCVRVLCATKRCWSPRHGSILHILHAAEQQTMTITQAIGQLEEAAASLHEPGVASTYRQTIERVRGFQEGTG